MDIEAVLSLFDSYWFNVEILKQPSNATPSSNSKKILDQKFQEDSPKTTHAESFLLDIQLALSYNSDSFSPDSVLQATPFQTGPKKLELKRIKGRRREKRRRTTAKKGLSKSLSELEHEELKGFMDLGFEFSEDDVNSSLVEIVPGLHKLGKNRDSDDNVKVKKLVKFESRSRPYLSEAWEVLERNKRMSALMNWKIPALSNEIDIKHSLKWWAHTVASTVKVL